MKITDVRIFPVGGAKLKAFVSIIFENCFIISDIKVIEGNKGLFLSMPSKKRKNGTFKDIAHPLNSETRNYIEDQVINKYTEVMANTDPSQLMSPSEVDEDDHTLAAMDDLGPTEEAESTPPAAIPAPPPPEPTF